MDSKQPAQYSPEETERRVKAAVQGAFKTPPKPLKNKKQNAKPTVPKQQPLAIDALKLQLPLKPRSA